MSLPASGMTPAQGNDPDKPIRSTGPHRAALIIRLVCQSMSHAHFSRMRANLRSTVRITQSIAWAISSLE